MLPAQAFAAPTSMATPQQAAVPGTAPVPVAPLYAPQVPAGYASVPLTTAAYPPQQQQVAAAASVPLPATGAQPLYQPVAGGVPASTGAAPVAWPQPLMAAPGVQPMAIVPLTAQQMPAALPTQPQMLAPQQTPAVVAFPPTTGAAAVSTPAQAPATQQQPEATTAAAATTPPSVSVGGSGAAKSSSGHTGQQPTINKKVEFQETNIFVSGLHPSIGDPDLQKIFTPFGEVLSARVLTHNQTGRSKGVGFVHFTTKEAATKAIKEMHGAKVYVPTLSTLPREPDFVDKHQDLTVAEILADTSYNSQKSAQSRGSGGMTESQESPTTCTVTVKLAENAAVFAPEVSNKLFIRNLPPTTTADDLKKAYQPYGAVIQTAVLPDRSSQGLREKTGLMMGYVTFSRITEATDALRATHCSTTLVPGLEKALDVKPAESLDRRNLRRQQSQQQLQKQQQQQQQSNLAPTSLAPPAYGPSVPLQGAVLQPQPQAVMQQPAGMMMMPPMQAFPQQQ